MSDALTDENRRERALQRRIAKRQEEKDQQLVYNKPKPTKYRQLYIAEWGRMVWVEADK